MGGLASCWTTLTSRSCRFWLRRVVPQYYAPLRVTRSPDVYCVRYMQLCSAWCVSWIDQIAMQRHSWLRSRVPTSSAGPRRVLARCSRSNRGSMEHTGVAILGAGFSGLCMAIQLKRAGRSDFVVYEAAADVGGTWRDNVYPGCACDVPSHLYSFSFAPTTQWSRVYAPQPDIWAYLKDCVKRFGIQDHIVYNTKIVECVFDAEQGAWHMTSQDGRQFTSKVAVVATGGLSKPCYPDIPGLSSFKGHISHTAAWDPAYDFTGKRVAVVGTGASAVQIVPALQPLVQQLVLFQRTPAWVAPKVDPEYTQQQQAAWWFPAWLALRRVVTYLFNELIFGRAVVGNDPKFAEAIEQEVKMAMAKHIKDPALREALTPKYRAGCKRICQSADFYPALAQPNVQVVPFGLDKVEPGNVVVGADGSRHEVDAIVLATGFKVGASITELKVTGLHGRHLQEDWAEKQPAYLGLAAAGYPNAFIIMGPNSGLGHNSVVFMAECQVNYIVQVLQWMQRDKLKWVEVRPGALAAFNERLQQRLQHTVWLSGCQSWYLQQLGDTAATAGGQQGADGAPQDNQQQQQPKKRQAAACRVETYVLWPWSTIRFWWETLRPNKAHWSGVPAVQASGAKQQLLADADTSGSTQRLAKEE